MHARGLKARNTKVTQPWGTTDCSTSPDEYMALPYWSHEPYSKERRCSESLASLDDVFDLRVVVNHVGGTEVARRSSRILGMSACRAGLGG